MKGIFSMFGLDEEELKTSVEKFGKLFESVDRLEQKLDRVLELLEPKREEETEHDGSDH